KTAPTPVTTTRRESEVVGIRPILRQRRCGDRRRGRIGLVSAFDVLREAGDRGENLAPDLLALDLDPELLLEGDDQLEGVHGVEPQALAEQRRMVVDHLRSHAVEVEAADDQ